MQYEAYELAQNRPTTHIFKDKPSGLYDALMYLYSEWNEDFLLALSLSLDLYLG